MNWNSYVFTLIDLRSFSNLWFWIMLALLWSSLSHNTLGVPHDMVVQARRRGGQAMADLEAMVDIQVRRRLRILRSGGVWLTGLWAAALSALFVLGFVYGIEIAQALTLLGLPGALVYGLRLRLATRLHQEAPRDEALTRVLTWHRLAVQVIGVVAVLVTALWGMWHNLAISVLGR